ncbi:hypothetical protein SS1G_09401 [Sclerotinia sclerotiorum 1980 UF-70]|uniref:Uncharacterized protein n=1 Tax=Sclerotinia sclerotiorum (strain ATCC 18683 / 1980 / Ss-1) TaxID=665079 RepID=A7EVP2_SCLS1|nr:hypothetical protein SS1G_09401 [Sclerotinia sclerotiorum 1980 UF-70]EDN93534.1 hypothetical protein SS1G_09401 [Sclerotinia sclerotiorum 1980 UF-70]
MHSNHLTQSFDIGCFSVLKRSYNSQIDGFIKNIKAGFRGTGLILFNPEAVLSKLDIRIHTSIPPSFNIDPWISQTLHNPTEALSQSTLVKSRISHHQSSSSTPIFETILALTKGTKRLTYKNTLLNAENRTFRKANKALSKRRHAKKIQLHQGGVLTGQEALDILSQQEVDVQIQRDERQKRGILMGKHLLVDVVVHVGELVTIQELVKIRSLPEIVSCTSQDELLRLGKGILDAIGTLMLFEKSFIFFSISTIGVGYNVPCDAYAKFVVDLLLQNKIRKSISLYFRPEFIDSVTKAADLDEGNFGKETLDLALLNKYYEILRDVDDEDEDAKRFATFKLRNLSKETSWKAASARRTLNEKKLKNKTKKSMYKIKGSLREASKILDSDIFASTGSKRYL